MAMFKVLRGVEANTPSTYTDGCIYFCKDTSNYYIDYIGTDGELHRSKIAAGYADKLRYMKDGQSIDVNPADIITKDNYLTVIGTATDSKAGLMSGAEHTKLTGIESGANKTIVDDAIKADSTNPVQNKVVKTELDKKAEKEHEHTQYENQNAFAKVTVGATTIEADNTSDGITIVGSSNVTVTPDAASKKITIEAKDTTYEAATSTAPGLMSAPDKAKLDAIDLRLKTWFGTCVTAASTAEKIVTTNTADFILEAGSIVYVQFNTAVTSTSTTLNVDNTGAVAIQTSATNALTANQIAPKSIVGFVYDGTVYRMLDSTIATTTYYGMTKLSSSTSSTSTATAATSSAVKAAYDLANSAVKQVIQATGAITPDDNGAITVDNVAYAANAAKLGDVASTEYLQKSGGTMSGNLIAASPAVGTQAVRNIYAGTADMTAGSSTLATGVIYCVYE